jgi:GT2 family glycosyltransferase
VEAVKPRLSIIIPNLNSPLVDRTLEAIRRQDFDLAAVEVLVVGVDEPGLVQDQPGVRFVPTGPQCSAAHNRNAGMAAAQGEIFCFTDADCEPDPNWLARLTARYADAHVQVVGGGVSFAHGNYWALCDNLAWFYKFLATSPVGERAHLPSLNLSVRRQVVEHVGGFDESFPGAAGEDTEWTQRMVAHGYRLHFEPRAVVHHAAKRHHLRDLWRHAYAYGRFSPKVRPGTSGEGRQATKQTEMEARFLPQERWQLLLLSPLLAALVTARIVWMHPRLEVALAVPGIWLSKMAWCLGAGTTLDSQGTE